MTRGQGFAAERDQDEVNHLEDALEQDEVVYAESIADQRAAAETRALLLEKLRSVDRSFLTLTLDQAEINLLIKALTEEDDHDPVQVVDVSAL